jgi:hypothetical protein
MGWLGLAQFSLTVFPPGSHGKTGWGGLGRSEGGTKLKGLQLGDKGLHFLKRVCASKSASWLHVQLGMP